LYQGPNKIKIGPVAGIIYNTESIRCNMIFLPTERDKRSFFFFFERKIKEGYRQIIWCVVILGCLVAA